MRLGVVEELTSNAEEEAGATAAGITTITMIGFRVAGAWLVVPHRRAGAHPPEDGATVAIMINYAVNPVDGAAVAIIRDAGAFTGVISLGGVDGGQRA